MTQAKSLKTASLAPKAKLTRKAGNVKAAKVSTGGASRRAKPLQQGHTTTITTITAITAANATTTTKAVSPTLRDKLDRDLMALLQANARESTADLARALGTARTTVLARLNRLERDGVIAGYTVKLGQDVVSRGLQAFVGVTVLPKAGRDVVRQLTRMPEVRQLCAVSGEFDYVVLLQAESAMRLDALLDEIGNFDGVVKTTTSVALAWKVDRL